MSLVNLPLILFERPGWSFGTGIFIVPPNALQLICRFGDASVLLKLISIQCQSQCKVS